MFLMKFVNMGKHNECNLKKTCCSVLHIRSRASLSSPFQVSSAASASSPATARKSARRSGIRSGRVLRARGLATAQFAGWHCSSALKHLLCRRRVSKLSLCVKEATRTAADWTSLRQGQDEGVQLRQGVPGRQGGQEGGGVR